MIRKYLFSAILIATLLLTGFAAQAGSSPAIAQEGPAVGPASPDADVTSAFTFQGYVQKNNVAVNGSCDFEFRLFTASGGGSQVGGLETRNGLAVSEGRFSAELDFGGNAFNGQGRWLEIRVRCPNGSGSFATLNPRQSLTAAPYALSLRPGAEIAGNTGGSSGILNLTNGGSGNGVRVDQVGGSGVSVNKANQDGLFVCATGSNSGCSPNDSIHSGVEVGNAEHYGLWVTNAGNDGVFIENAGDDGLQVVSAGDDGLDITANDDGLRVRQAGSNGVHIESANIGVRVDSAVNDGMFVPQAGRHGVDVQHAGNDGVFVCATGSRSGCSPNDSLHNGFEIGNAEHYGLWVNAAGNDGVMIIEAGDDGMQIVNAGNDGIDILDAGDDGVQVRQAINGLHVQNANNGVLVDSAEIGIAVLSSTANGVQVASTAANGVQINSAPNGSGLAVGTANTGVFVNSATNWAGFFNGPIFATSYNGAVTAFGINTGASALAPGDVVALQGTRSGDSVGQPMLMEVGPAEAGAPLVGVVYGRGELAEVGGVDGQGITQLVPRAGAAQPGDYVQIVIYGPLQVKASALGQAIAMGDKLAVNDGGAARSLQTVEVGGVQLAENAPTIGIALEGLGASKEGLIWVLVNPQ